MPEVRYKGFKDREALQRDAEWRRFLVIAEENSVRSYLEVGLAYGTTFHSMCSAIAARGPAGLLVGVDQPAYGDGPASVGAACEDLLLRHNLSTVIIWGDSHDVRVRARAEFLLGAHTPGDDMTADRYDLVFIDADHTYEAVKQDFNDYAPMAKIIAFHDIDSAYHPPNEGSTRLWNEIKTFGHRFEEIIIRPDPPIPDEGFGIGVLWL